MTELTHTFSYMCGEPGTERALSPCQALLLGEEEAVCRLSGPDPSHLHLRPISTPAPS